MDNKEAVYASDSNGVPLLITGIGMKAPGGGVVTEVGVPSMMPDGRVIFGAESQPKDTNIKARWNIFIGNADAIPSHRMIAALNPKALGGDCTPAFKGDPYPIADMDGTIPFLSTVSHVRDALFLYNCGSMAMILPTGTLTRVGHVTCLSAGRGGLMADGTTAVLAGCARISAIFRLTRPRLDLRIERGQLTPFGTELKSLGHPV